MRKKDAARQLGVSDTMFTTYLVAAGGEFKRTIDGKYIMDSHDLQHLKEIILELRKEGKRICARSIADKHAEKEKADPYQGLTADEMIEALKRESIRRNHLECKAFYSRSSHSGQDWKRCGAVSYHINTNINSNNHRK
ncbi:MAG: hypothetical protein IKR17_05970 [Bacteroidales bacterium]|nr:hypothetical protein [Bacteroidales bacterium]